MGNVPLVSHFKSGHVSVTLPYTYGRYEDPVADILIGLLRLRQVSNVSFRPEMVGKRCSIVRELHVYGSAVPLQVRVTLPYFVENILYFDFSVSERGVIK